MDFDDRANYFNLCKTEEPLDPDDDRNVDFDNAAAGEQPRGDGWATRLAKKIGFSAAAPDNPACILMTGLPGSGKSTELRRLAQRLRGSFHGGKRLFPVLIDANTFVDLTAQLDVADVLLGVVHYTERSVLEIEGQDPDKADRQSAMERIWHWLTETEVSLKNRVVPVPFGKLALEFKTNASLRKQVQTAVGAHLSAFCKQVRREMESLVTRAAKRKYDNLVILVDSLEKLRGSSSEWEKVLDSAEQLFQNGAPNLRLPVHVVYTVPAALKSRNVPGIEFMPMVKIHERDGKTPFEPGIRAMRELVARRIPDDALAQLLGEPYEARIRDAIRWSGGYPRELLRFLQEMLMSETFPVSDRAWQRIRGRIFDPYREQIPEDAFAWLAQVHVNKYITPSSKEARQAADRMLLANVVLHYCNTQSWYDLHPAVLEIPGVQQAIKDRRESDDAESP